MRRTKSNRKILIFFVLAYLLITAVFGIMRFRDESRRWDLITRDRLKIGATTIKYMLPDGYINRAKTRDSITEAEYNTICTALSHAAWENEFEYLYLIKQVDGKFYFIASGMTKLDIAKGKFEPYWLEYVEAPREISKAFKTGKPVYARVTDRWGTFYSAFIPEYSSDGEMYLAGADYNYDIVKNYLSGIVFGTILQAFVLLFLLLLIYLSLTRLQKHYIRRLQFSNTVNQASPVGVISLLPDGTIEYVNQIFGDLTGVPLPRLDGNNINTDIGFQKNDELINRIRICLSRQISWQGEFLNRTSEGKDYWVNAQIHYIKPEKNAKALLNVYASDITPQMTSRISLAQHNRIFKFLSQTIHMMLANPDLDEAFPQVMMQYGQNLNKSKVALLKHLVNNYEIVAVWSQTDDSSHSIPVNVFSKGLKAIHSDWEDDVESGDVVCGEAYDFPMSLLTMSRISTPGIVHICPVFCQNRYWGFLITLQSQRDEMLDRDLENSVLNSISDSIGNALNRNQIDEALRNATDAKTSFLSSMSHEIRTPLNGVVGMINLMESTNLTPEQREYLDAIRISGKQLLSLINNILDISRIEAGKAVLRSDPIRLTNCIHAAANMVSFELKEKEITLQINLDPALPKVVIGDETRLRQIVLNLIHNAIKFTEKGIITIDAIRLNQKRLLFKVSDTGIGMTVEAAEHIFEPFYQSGDSSQKMKGIGLGLAIVKHLVELMHGNISVQSTLGKGTSFIFEIELPILEDSLDYSRPEQLAEEKQTEESLMSSLIFVRGGDMDDKIIDNFLHSLGYQPLCLSNQAELVNETSLPQKKMVILNFADGHELPLADAANLDALMHNHQNLHWLILISDGKRISLPALTGDNVSILPKPIVFEKVIEVLKTYMVTDTPDLSSSTAKPTLETH